MAKKRAAARATTKEKAPSGQLDEPETLVPAVDEPASKERWEMPRPVRGQSIIFYRNCMVSQRNSEIGFVAMVGERSISITYQNQGADDCYHIDDPRLLENQEIRNHIDGVWEFTKEKLEIETRFRDLEQRIKDLEG